MGLTRHGRLVRRLRHTPAHYPNPVSTIEHNPQTDDGDHRARPWKIASWSAAALVLVVPLIAMQFTDEVNWSAADFVMAGALVLGVGTALELAVRRTRDAAYRWAAGLALAAAFLLVWLNGAVGVIGSEGNVVNLLFGGVVAVALAGALVARFRPHGMARAMAAAALAQAVVATGALVAGLTAPERDPIEVAVLWGFVALWAGSAVLFQKASRPRRPANSGPQA